MTGPKSGNPVLSANPTHKGPHDNVIKWKHVLRYWPFVREFAGPGEFPAQRPVTRSFDVLLDLRLE